MGGWEMAASKDGELRQARRIISILVDEIERKDQRIIDLQRERDASLYGANIRIRPVSESAVQESDRKDDPALATRSLRNVPV